MRCAWKSMIAFSCLFLVLAAIAISEEPKDNDYGPPWACPLWEVMYFEGAVLYYCDYYQNSCNEEPTAAYVIGNYPWPEICPDCISVLKVRDVPKKFTGLESTELEGPISPDIDFHLPGGPASRFSAKVSIPGLEFVCFKDVRGDVIVAKVFAFELDLAKALDDPSITETRTMLIALQIEGSATGKVTPIIADPCKPLEETGICCAYRGVHTPEEGKPIPILVLTGR